MLYVFHGEDDFTMAEEVRRLEAAVGPSDSLDANRHRMSGQALNPQTLRAHCNAMPFLAERRLIVAEGVLAQAAPKRRGAKARAAADAQDGDSAPAESGRWDSLVDYAAEMPPTTDLVLMERTKTATAPCLTAS